jgi:hypothetical protein
MVRVKSRPNAVVLADHHNLTPSHKPAVHENVYRFACVPVELHDRAGAHGKNVLDITPGLAQLHGQLQFHIGQQAQRRGVRLRRRSFIKAGEDGGCGLGRALVLLLAG